MTTKNIALIANDIIIDKMRLEKNPAIYDNSFEIINIDDNNEITNNLKKNSIIPGMFSIRSPYKANSFIPANKISSMYSTKLQLTSSLFAILGAKNVYLEQIKIKKNNQEYTLKTNKETNGKIKIVSTESWELSASSEKKNESISASNNKNTYMEKFIIDNTYKGMDCDTEKANFFLQKNLLDKDDSLNELIEYFNLGIFPSTLNFEVKMETDTLQTKSVLNRIINRYEVSADFCLKSIQAKTQCFQIEKEDILEEINSEYYFALKVIF